MSEGILVYAHNNNSVDYVSIAYVASKYAQKNLNRPVSLVTDQGSVEWLYSRFPDSKNFFESIIIVGYDTLNNLSTKRYYDGSLSYKLLNFKNVNRTSSFYLTPYKKTLVIDSDLLITNDLLKNVWNSNEEFMILKNHNDLAINRDNFEFKNISEYSVNFYWATAFYFEKTENNRIFFELCEHIKSNYKYYCFLYRISDNIFRNDFVFSIAIHILYGFSNITFPPSLPTKIHYVLDKDDFYDVLDEKTFVFLTAKRDYLGEYNLVKTQNQNVHVMNKYGLSRNIEKLLEVLK
jgi:hypothetical protein